MVLSLASPTLGKFELVKKKKSQVLKKTPKKQVLCGSTNKFPSASFSEKRRPNLAVICMTLELNFYLSGGFSPEISGHICVLRFYVT